MSISSRLSLCVEGMSCGGCAAHIQSKLSELPGVVSAAVSFDTKTAEVTLSDATAASLVEEKIRSMGYVVTVAVTPPPPRRLRTVTMSVAGMSCGGCAANIESKIAAIPGVVRAAVSFDTKSATICVGDPVDTTVLEAVHAKMVSMGYVVGSAEVSADQDAPDAAAVATGGNPAEVVAFPPSPPPPVAVAALAAPPLPSPAPLLDGPRPPAAAAPAAAPLAAAAAPAAVRIKVDGMSCASCSAKIERKIAGISGVSAAAVSFVTGMATVTCAGDSVAHRVVEDIRDLGYEAKLVTAAPAPTKPQLTSTATFRFDDVLPAAACATLEESLQAVPGVLGATCKAGMLEAHVSYDPTAIGEAALLAHITSLGIAVTAASRDLGGRKSARSTAVSNFLIEGMTCTSCAARIEKELRRTAGVLYCTVNFATTSAAVTRDPALISDEEICKLVSALGYNITRTDESTTSIQEAREALARTKEIAAQRRLFWLSFVFSTPLMILAMASMVNDTWMHAVEGFFHGALIFDIVQGVLAAPVVLWCGRGYFYRAWKALRTLTFTMDTLVAVGVGTTFLFSIGATVVRAVSKHHHITCYYDAGATLITFMLLGKYLEAKAKSSTCSALMHLMDLAPQTALLITADGDIEVPCGALTVGCEVRVLAGSRIPVDGIVVSGTSAVDEQLVTGESKPRDITAGDKVIGGTLNLTGAIVMSAEKVGEETMLSQILRVVQEAQNSKPAIQRVADRIASVFVPTVLVIAATVLTVWMSLGATDSYPAAWREGDSYIVFAFSFFIATVVVACPCALGLATPTAVMVGTGVGAQLGVLIKNAETLELAGRVNCILFDKTGTLTQGKLKVQWSQSYNCGPLEATRVLQVVSAVEALSTHPLAKAICDEFAPATNVTVEVETVAGSGVVAVVRGSTASGSPATSTKVVIGSQRYLREIGVQFTDAALEDIFRVSSKGCTPVVCAFDGVLKAIIGLADEPKPESAAVVRYLRATGRKVMMVTGDNEIVAKTVAATLGIAPDCVVANVLPQDKAAAVRAQQEQRQIVAFVGDGINDSPALSQADVSVALGAGTEIAIESANAILMHSSLNDLVVFFQLSETTVRRIWMNFIWAFGYNLIMIPLASGILFPALRFQLPPIAAGAAMIFSSLSVLASSLLLYRFKPSLPDPAVTAATARGEQVAETVSLLIQQ